MIFFCVIQVQFSEGVSGFVCNPHVLGGVPIEIEAEDAAHDEGVFGRIFLCEVSFYVHVSLQEVCVAGAVSCEGEIFLYGYEAVCVAGFEVCVVKVAASSCFYGSVV